MGERFIDIIRERQKVKLTDMFRKHGYNTQIAIARALQNNGYYQESKEISVRAYLSQVITGTRKPSHKLLEGLASLCDNDPEIMRNFKTNDEISVDEYISLVLDKTYVTFKERVETLDRKEKLVALIELEDYLRSYLERLKTPALKQ